MMEQNGWMEVHFERFDWEVMGRALGVETHDFQVRVVKMIHDWQNVGSQKRKIHGSRETAMRRHLTHPFQQRIRAHCAARTSNQFMCRWARLRSCKRVQCSSFGNYGSLCNQCRRRC